ncbi:MAG TPA: glycosyltransferase family 1 protein [Actinomycetota bacterium]|jgi:glycosyltransferase involved in cell wall biosynthesis|nr:glycosyltransferase family 1 protein [Actinomycetota bacterium]
MTSVAFHVDQVFYDAPGGIGTYVRELVPALSSADGAPDVTLFHAAFPGRRGEPWMDRFPTRELPHGIQRLYPEWALLGRPPLPDDLGGMDLVHAPSPVALPPPGPGQRLVVTVHDLAFRVYPRLFPAVWRNLFRAGVRRAARNADALITVSEHTARDLVRFTRADPNRVHVVPLAAALPDAGADPGDVVDRLKVPRPYLLFVGVLEPRKNLVRLVRAYRRAALAGGLHHALVLAGPMGWHARPLLREVATPGPGEVVLTGRVGARELDALYRGASAFAYPSLYEGFGLPVLEAMVRGVPVVTSAISSLPEVTGDAALLVEPRSTGQLAEAIERVLAEEDLAARLSAAGRARASAFSWERTARMTLQVYEKVVG